MTRYVIVELVSPIGQPAGWQVQEEGCNLTTNHATPREAYAEITRRPNFKYYQGNHRQVYLKPTTTTGRLALHKLYDELQKDLSLIHI